MMNKYKSKNNRVKSLQEEDGLSTYDLTLIASRIYSELTPVSEIDYFEDYDEQMAA